MVIAYRYDKFVIAINAKTKSNSSQEKNVPAIKIWLSMPLLEIPHAVEFCETTILMLVTDWC